MCRKPPRRPMRRVRVWLASHLSLRLLASAPPPPLRLIPSGRAAARLSLPYLPSIGATRLSPTTRPGLRSRQPHIQSHDVLFLCMCCVSSHLVPSIIQNAAVATKQQSSLPNLPNVGHEGGADETNLRPSPRPRCGRASVHLGPKDVPYPRYPLEGSRPPEIALSRGLYLPPASTTKPMGLQCREVPKEDDAAVK